MSLGPRLEAILDLLRPCTLLVDVGTDHGLVPLEAVRRGIAARAVGVDKKHRPLDVARRNHAAAGSPPEVSFVLGDGLAGHVPDAVVIAGVGARLAMRVVDARAMQVVVQLNAERDRFERHMTSLGFTATDVRHVGPFQVTRYGKLDA